MNQELAAEIMGENFFGYEEAMKCYDLRPTPKQLSALSEIPFSEETLRECKDTHILIAIFPISILNIQRRMGTRGVFINKGIKEEASVVGKKNDLGWRLVCKTLIPDKNPEEQKKLLNETMLGEGIPSAEVMLYVMVEFNFITNKWLFEGLHARTSSVYTPSQTVVGVAYGGAKRLNVIYYAYWADQDELFWGLAHEKKPNNK
jgi:hypothetical protein